MTTNLTALPPSPPGQTGWPWNNTASISASEARAPEHWPRISIVTPSFQQGATLEKTLRSVLQQGYPNLQYIVIDGGSTDESLAILKKYAASLDFWVSEKDRGQSHAINKGLERCTGDIFNWLNSDDTLESGALFDVARLWRGADLLLVSGGCENVLEDGQVAHYWTARPPARLRDFFVPQAVVLAQPSTFLKTSAVRALGGIREDLECVMDWELYVRLLLRCPTQWKTARTERCLARALQHPGAKTQRLAARFPEEAGRLMAEWLPLAPAAERPWITARRQAMAAESLVTETARQPHSLLALLRLALAHGNVLRSRFFWGALRRALRVT